jgi:hypothetical protein
MRSATSATSRRTVPARAAALVLAVAWAAAPASAWTLLGPATPADARLAREAARATPRQLLASRNLWATIDVCSPADQRDTVGIRGSMPGDGSASDRMYMIFRLQVQAHAGGRWKALGQASEYVLVGGAGTAREAGTSFVIRPPNNGKTLLLRGVVIFQWRHGFTLMQSTRRITSAGHESAAGADPAGFSSATCVIG